MFGVEAETLDIVASCIAGILAGIAFRYISDKKYKRRIQPKVYGAWSILALVGALFVHDLLALLPLFGFDEDLITQMSATTPMGLRVSAAILITNLDRKYDVK